MVGKIGVFPLPGNSEAIAPSFLGGSVLGISAKSQNQGLAAEFLKLISSEGFQSQYAEAGLIPNQKTYLDLVTGSPGAEAQAQAAENSRFTPSSEYWAEVEGGDILQDMGTTISNANAE
jgi:N,N'-diacetylchitobiose transport system substrate-binding protein